MCSAKGPDFITDLANTMDRSARTLLAADSSKGATQGVAVKQAFLAVRGEVMSLNARCVRVVVYCLSIIIGCDRLTRVRLSNRFTFKFV
jgi:hypothetical protein